MKDENGGGMAVNAKVKKATISAKVQRIQPDGTYKVEDLGVVCELGGSAGARFVRAVKRAVKKVVRIIKK